MEVLAASGHDCDWVGSWPQDPGDDEILAAALAESRVVVTLDKDFGELAVVRGARHAGIIRLVGFRAQDQGLACCRLVQRYCRELESGALITATPERVRVRPPELEI